MFVVRIALGDTSAAKRMVPLPSSRYRDNYDAETLLQAAFDEAWAVLMASGTTFDQEAARTALADSIMMFASEGETDPKALKRLALAALPRIIDAYPH